MRFFSKFYLPRRDPTAHVCLFCCCSSMCIPLPIQSHPLIDVMAPRRNNLAVTLARGRYPLQGTPQPQLPLIHDYLLLLSLTAVAVLIDGGDPNVASKADCGWMVRRWWRHGIGRATTSCRGVTLTLSVLNSNNAVACRAIKTYRGSWLGRAQRKLRLGG